MADFKLVSADSHLNEVAATWERVQKKHGDRAPKVVWNPEEGAVGPFLVIDGWKSGLDFTGRGGGQNLNRESLAANYIGMLVGPMGLGGHNAPLGRQAKEVSPFIKDFRFEDYKAPWDPAARLECQDKDNLAAEVLYPSHLRHFYEICADDEQFFRDICESYNEWVMEFGSYDPKRLIALPVLSVLNPEGAAEDLYKYAKRGAKGFMVASSVPIGISYGDPMFDPLWRAAEECGTPLALHSTSGRFKRHQYIVQGAGNFDAGQMEAQASLAEIVYGGVFDRFPALKIVLAEFDIGWAAYVWQKNHLPAAGLKLKTSEYMERNVWFTFQNDKAGCMTAPLYGHNRFMWASDFPHGETTWPYSEQVVDEQTEGLDPGLKYALARGNVCELYGLEL